jgi:hypothetical protein
LFISFMIYDGDLKQLINRIRIDCTYINRNR